MSKNKNKNQYGSFATKTPWYLKRKFIAAGFALAVLFVGLQVGYQFYKDYKSEKLAELLKINTVVASDMPGWWYLKYFGFAVCEKEICKSESDPDNDKLTNAQEFYYHSDPLNADTNNNGLSDGDDVAYNYDPSREGKVTFEEVVNEDNILGESLLLQKDIEQIVNESQDISKVSLPLVPVGELRITYEDTAQVYESYFSDLKSKTNKYFKEDELDDVNLILQYGGSSEVDDIRTDAALLALELKKMTVPHRMIVYHQYVIAFYDLLSKVLGQDPSTMDMASVESDVWFENSRALFAVSQKLNFEQQRLKLSIEANR